MSKAWKSLDLEGGGLQTINQALTAKMKSRLAAYGLWLLFPLGLHRFYLRQVVPAIFALIGLDLIAVAGLVMFGFGGGWSFLLPLAVAGLYELWWIDRRVTEINKELRMNLYLRKGYSPPKDYRGRVADNDQLIEDYQLEKEQEKVGGTAKEATPSLGRQHVMSFSEQEKLLREMKKARAKKDD